MTNTSVNISSLAERLRKGATIFLKKAILQNRLKKTDRHQLNDTGLWKANTQ
jgi:hypothetical protein